MEKWYEFEPPDNSYKIEFPEKPIYRPETSIVDYGKLEIDVYLHESSKANPENYTYFVAKTVYPDTMIKMYSGDIDAFFNSSIQGSVNAVHGEIITQTEIELNGIPGRKVRIDYQKGEAVITMRIYLDGSIGYIVQTVTATNNDFNLAQNRFFESFEINY